MRIATFNLESLDLPPRAEVPLETRAEILRPVLARLEADVLCLQEVNGQLVPGQAERELTALDQLLKGTPYACYNRVSTTGANGRGVCDVHNLVTLSRLPVLAMREVRHNLVPPLQHTVQTAVTADTSNNSLRFDRPILVTDFDVGSGRRLPVINLHLRAPLAAAIPGQKLTPFAWKSVSAWAEGYFLAAVRRAAQALELRLLVDRMLSENPHLLIAVAGDFN
ncbi:MAG TPA: endonuclease/exonuclease/phosphatase family protein, partial [Hyphomicrobium sp.]|nr:endonuclease/exonuclease/phosphatase family protein [Hyphomicrobium sp.]